MTEETLADEAVLSAPGSARTSVRAWSAIRRYWHWAAVIALALIVWAPRLTGPIDLRWDAGVYYVLGTSLATGHGYRILSEPGSPEALQYPPLLPAVVALFQRALGSTDPAVVAPWLRISYAGLFLAYALAVLALARKYLRPTFALLAAALCLLHVWTIFLSDMLFAELPFTLVSVVFVLVVMSTWGPWLREIVSFGLAATGFLLRTAGVVLLMGWVLEALLRRHWRLALMRGALALIPVLLWQTHVARVHRSYEYAHPAYEYQRAGYQFYNVSYAESAGLADPSHPTLGTLNAGALLARVGTNLRRIAIGLGEAISATEGYWRQFLSQTQRSIFGRNLIPLRAVLLPIVALSALVTAGVGFLAHRRAWLMVLIILTSVGLISTAPWLSQFERYLVPLAPFLTISAILTLVKIYGAVRAARVGHASRTVAQIAIAGFLLLTLLVQIYSVTEIFRLRQSEGASFVAGRGVVGSPFFLHDPLWRGWEQAVGWIDQHASADAIVATAYSHLCYLRTGRRGVSPPLEPDPARARQLLESVPVSYVIVDRGYSLPAIESDSEGWHLVQSFEGTRLYERAIRPQ